EHGAVLERGADLAGRGIGAAVVVDRKTLAGPDHGRFRARPGLGDVLDRLVDRHDRAAILVMAGDDAADAQAHRLGLHGFVDRDIICRRLKRIAIGLGSWRVARIERSEMRGSLSERVPDFAALNPGYRAIVARRSSD